VDKEKLAEQGIDVDDALNRFMGNEDLYVKCLGQFLEDENYPKLIAALDAQDYDNAFTYAHTLKGLAGNLSLKDLYNAVIPLVESLRHKEFSDVDAQRKATEEAYATSVGAIKGM